MYVKLYDLCAFSIFIQYCSLSDCINCPVFLFKTTVYDTLTLLIQIFYITIMVSCRQLQDTSSYPRVSSHECHRVIHHPRNLGHNATQVYSIPHSLLLSAFLSMLFTGSPLLLINIQYSMIFNSILTLVLIFSILQHLLLSKHSYLFKSTRDIPCIAENTLVAHGDTWVLIAHYYW